MRQLFTGLLAAGVMLASATTVAAAPRSPKAVKASPMVYLCVDCQIGGVRVGPCPVCKGAMGRVATYGCMSCYISSDLSGPCPNCREPMKSVVARYRQCGTCSYYHNKGKKACRTCLKRQRGRRFKVQG